MPNVVEIFTFSELRELREWHKVSRDHPESMYGSNLGRENGFGVFSIGCQDDLRTEQIHGDGASGNVEQLSRPFGKLMARDFAKCRDQKINTCAVSAPNWVNSTGGRHLLPKGRLWGGLGAAMPSARTFRWVAADLRNRKRMNRTIATP